MKHSVIAAATCLSVLVAASASFAQAKPTPAQKPAATAAVPATQAPVAPAKYYKPVKGIASIQIIPSASKRVGEEIVTTIKIKNISEGAIHLLKVDEYWYAGKDVVTGDTQSWRKPFNPGEVIEVKLSSPFKKGLTGSQYMYSHANGKIDVKRVKTFDEPKKK